MLIGCSSDDLPTNIEPTLHAGDATDITRTEATLHGAIDLADGANMPELSFVYGMDETMSSSSAMLSEDSIAIRIGGLKSGSTYYFALQGSRGNATFRSNTSTFTTNPNVRPEVGELQLLSYGPLSAIVKVTIIDNGGENLTEVGCYVKDIATGTTRKIKAMAIDVNRINESATDTNGIKLRIDSMARYATYEISPFATNSIGETVGNAITHTTTNAATLEQGGELSSLIGNDINAYTSLSIAGCVNGDDIACLREMMTNGYLYNLDLTDARIVTGGGTYGYSRYTEEDAITYGMFGGCTRLENIVLPDNVRRIDHEAFIDCTGLKSLTIPASANSVSTSSGCTALEAISVSAANSNYKGIDGVLYNGNATAILWFPLGKQGDYEIPSTVTTIEDRAFEGCAIQKLTLPDNITEIGMAAFHNCKIEEAWMPEQLKAIPTATFQGCTSLTTIHLGSKTELIGEYAFDGCPLSDIYITAATPPVCYAKSFATSGSDFLSTCTLHVPKDYKQIYRNHKYWGQFNTIKEL